MAYREIQVLHKDTSSPPIVFPILNIGKQALPYSTIYDEDSDIGEVSPCTENGVVGEIQRRYSLRGD